MHVGSSSVRSSPTLCLQRMRTGTLLSSSLPRSVSLRLLPHLRGLRTVAVVVGNGGVIVENAPYQWVTTMLLDPLCPPTHPSHTKCSSLGSHSSRPSLTDQGTWSGYRLYHYTITPRMKQKGHRLPPCDSISAGCPSPMGTPTSHDTLALGAFFFFTDVLHLGITYSSEKSSVGYACSVFGGCRYLAAKGP